MALDSQMMEDLLVRYYVESEHALKNELHRKMLLNCYYVRILLYLWTLYRSLRFEYPLTETRLLWTEPDKKLRTWMLQHGRDRTAYEQLMQREESYVDIHQYMPQKPTKDQLPTIPMPTILSREELVDLKPLCIGYPHYYDRSEDSQRDRATNKLLKQDCIPPMVLEGLFSAPGAPKIMFQPYLGNADIIRHRMRSDQWECRSSPQMEEEQMQALGAPDPSVQLKPEFIALLDECSFEFDDGLQFSLSQEDSDDNSKQKVDLLNTGG
ncbi:MAG: hypothetical protein GY799_12175, partial [Desulfobulbaceae bacterium]|nr:hypothetical protein [Desulfobulbaceae bacterium]